MVQGNRGPLAAPALQRLPDLGQQLLPGERLRKERGIQGGEAVLHQDLGRVARHVQDPLIRIFPTGAADQLDPVPIREHYVHQQQVHPASRHAEQVERLAGVGRLKYPVAGLAQDQLREAADGGLIIHNQYRGDRGRKWTGQQRSLGEEADNVAAVVPGAV